MIEQNLQEDYCKRDLRHEVERLYQRYNGKAQPISQSDIDEAALIVSHLFPPRRQLTVLRLLAALNLLNAAVKRAPFQGVVSYKFIKGMCSYLSYSLLVWPVPGISLWLDRKQNITYFRVMGVQFSFHFVPMFPALRREWQSAPQPAQAWDGMRLQNIAVEVLRMAVPTPFAPPVGHAPALPVSTTDIEREVVMSHIRRRFCGVLVHSERYGPQAYNNAPETCPRCFTEDAITSLHTALTFNMQDEDCFMLYRRKDRRVLRVMRYNGKNYDELIDYLCATNKRVWKRRRATLEVGKLYFLSPLQRIRSLSPGTQTLAKTRNSYLIRNGLFRNLCLTYSIACYLARHYPTLRFVKTLNYNRLSVRHTYYNYTKLQKVPLGSIARYCKVWIVIDRERELASFEYDMLPQALIDDYLNTEDFYKEFKVEKINGLKGVRGWYYHWLLPPIFPDIRVRNYHALVRGANQKWGVFSLCEEKFVSHFIYDSVIYDRDDGCIYGISDGVRRIIVRFNYDEF